MISPIGLVVAGLGIVALTSPIWWSLFLIIVLSPFRTAMALSPPGMGGASVLVPHFFLLFFALRGLRKFGPGPMVSALLPPSAGFFLLLLLAYGLFGSVFYPRLLAGITETVSLFRGEDGESLLMLTPLAFGGTYVTQAIYAIGGVVAFATSFAFFREKGALNHLLTAMLAVCILNVTLALLDLLTHLTGTGYLLEFMRNASYGILTDSEKGGLKRITGSFSEASAFAVFTLALFAFTFSLWLDKVTARRSSAIISIVLLGLLLASTSGTAYVGLIIVLSFILMRHSIAQLGGQRGQSLGGLLGLGLVGVAALLSCVVLLPDMATSISDFLDETVFDKTSSQSGLERAMWNAVAFQNTIDTYGLGVGIGGARASSYILVLLSNVGIPGFLLYLLFIGKVLFAKPSPQLSDREVSIVRALRACLIGFLTGHCLVGTIFDQGPLFYTLAGAAAASVFAPRQAFIRLLRSRPGPHPGFQASTS